MELPQEKTAKHYSHIRVYESDRDALNDLARAWNTTTISLVHFLRQCGERFDTAADMAAQLGAETPERG